jgi:hypothetical protein
MALSDHMLSQLCKLGLDSCEEGHSVGGYSVTDVSGEPVCPIFNF